ncbi:MAG: sugar transferase [Candidatus Hydrogenedentes bacterium]|nr:sugar transferase [Candidatus Hydrogenedentota bacterium]
MKAPSVYKQEERGLALLCLATDLLCFWIGLNLASLFRLVTLIRVDYGDLQRDRIACLVLFAVCMVAAGAYRSSRLSDRFDSIYFSGLGVASTLVGLFLVVALLPRDLLVISRRELVLGPMIGFVLIVLWRELAVRVFKRFPSFQRVFVVFGDPVEGRRLAAELTRAEGSYLTAHYAGRDAADAEANDLDSIEASAGAGHAEAIICGDNMDLEPLTALTDFCEPRYRRTYLYPSLQDTLLFQHSEIASVAGVPLIEVTQRLYTGGYARLKRVIDVATALAALVLLSPVAAAAALAVKLSSPGGVLYRQERIGLLGAPFYIYKFRTMYADVERESGPKWAEENDPRITPVGRVLRRHRIDEIPQLWNVLRGDMSLVGPRPERPHFVDEFSKRLPLFKRRLVVKPGLTSLSHVKGSYSSEPADRLRYDLVYIGNLSLLTDLRILFSTVRIVLSAKGAR